MGEVKGRDKETRRKRGKKGRKAKTKRTGDREYMVGKERLGSKPRASRKLCRRDGSVAFFRL